jgi:hypothetical protein
VKAPDLPLEARAALSRLDGDPELKELVARCYPTKEQDSEVRARKAAERAEAARQAHENRIQLCKRAEDREFGKEVQQHAAAVLAETGGEYTATAVQRIVTKIRDWEREKREQRRGRK